jgi:hypothetical protein
VVPEVESLVSLDELESLEHPHEVAPGASIAITNKPVRARVFIFAKALWTDCAVYPQAGGLDSPSPCARHVRPRCWVWLRCHAG